MYNPKTQPKSQNKRINQVDSSNQRVKSIISDYLSEIYDESPSFLITQFTITDFVVDGNEGIYLINTVKESDINIRGRVYHIVDDQVMGYLSETQKNGLETSHSEISFGQRYLEDNYNIVTIKIDDYDFYEGNEGTMFQCFKFKDKVYLSSSNKFDTSNTKWGDTKNVFQIWQELGGPENLNLIFQNTPDSFYFKFIISTPELSLASSRSYGNGKIYYFEPFINYKFQNQKDMEKTMIPDFSTFGFEPVKMFTINDVIKMETDFIFCVPKIDNEDPILKINSDIYHYKSNFLGKDKKNVGPLDIMSSYNLKSVDPSERKPGYPEIKFFDTKYSFGNIRELSLAINDMSIPEIEKIILDSEVDPSFIDYIDVSIDDRLWNIFLNYFLSISVDKKIKTIDDYYKVNKIYDEVVDITLDYLNEKNIANYDDQVLKNLKSFINQYKINKNTRPDAVLFSLKYYCGSKIYNIWKSYSKRVSNNNKQQTVEIKDLI